MRKSVYHILLFLLVSVRVAGQSVEDTRCERLASPDGIDLAHPRLSWRLNGQGNGLRQVAWQVIVASSREKLRADKGDLWNSGKVSGDRCVLVPYAGKALQSREVCFWKVRVWTNRGDSVWSEYDYWTMGLLNASDWKAKWIGYDQAFPWDSVSKFSRLSARYFRKRFYCPPGMRHATLYVVGLGHYKIMLDGKPVENKEPEPVLAQAPTDYTRTVLYKTYYIGNMAGGRERQLEVVLGNGRYFTMRPKYKPQKIKEFGFPKLLLQLEMEDSTGKKFMVVSDTSWQFTADGPIRSNNEYDGEEYDARKEGLSHWMRSQLVAPPGGILRSQLNPDIVKSSPVFAVRKWRVAVAGNRDSVWMIDFGRNIAGWVKLKVNGSSGTQVKMRFGESLQKDGSLYTANLRDALATDIYTLKGGAEESWEPSFVYHGFRYVEVSGFPGEPKANNFEAVAVGDDLSAGGGTVNTSDSMLNSILRNANWGISANYKGMPIDCPQRNERMPWLGDRATGSLGEAYLGDVGSFYAKWLNDIEDSQKPDGQLPDVAPAYWNYYSDNMTWPGVYILVADMLYRQYADTMPIRKHYASMKKWLDYMSGKYEKNGIMTKDKYGDWCVPPESPRLIHSKDSTRLTDGQLIATAYYYHLLRLMEGFAGLLGLDADGKGFGAKAGQARAAFNAKFFNTADGFYSNNTVTANLLPLYFGMVAAGDTAKVFKHITDKIEKENNSHISTGVIGTQWLMRGLTRFGRPDLAYRLASNTDYPSWGYMVKQGATTIWELWNGNTADPAMNSQNHVMLLGDLVAWYFEDLAGIAPAEPGFRTIRMKPAFGCGLGEARGEYRTPYGMVSSSWKKTGGIVVWDILVPANTRAELWLADGTRQDVGSGSYHFEVKEKI